MFIIQRVYFFANIELLLTEKVLFAVDYSTQGVSGSTDLKRLSSCIKSFLLSNTELRIKNIVLKSMKPVIRLTSGPSLNQKVFDRTIWFKVRRMWHLSWFRCLVDSLFWSNVKESQFPVKYIVRYVNTSDIFYTRYVAVALKKIYFELTNLHPGEFHIYI